MGDIKDSTEQIVGVISNAETMRYSKKTKAFEATMKGSESRKIFDVSIKAESGSLVAHIEETGANGKGEVHHYPLDQVVAGGGATKTGGKRPHYSGRDG